MIDAPPLAAGERVLLHRAERTEVAAWSDCVAAAPPALARELGIAAVPVADGIALVVSGVTSVLYNRTFGIGLDRTLTEAEIDDAIALYSHERPFSIQPTPYANPPEVHSWLDARGLIAWFHWVRWIRGVEPTRRARCDLAIEVVGPAGAQEFLELARGIFNEPEQVMPWMGHTVGRRDWTHYVARDGARAVATAALYVNGDTGWLGWGGTLASHRGRGAQSAMLARRIDDARELGCTALTVETAEDLPDRPNPSYRNVARAGFRVLCLRPSHAFFPPDSSRPE